MPEHYSREDVMKESEARKHIDITTNYHYYSYYHYTKLLLKLDWFCSCNLDCSWSSVSSVCLEGQGRKKIGTAVPVVLMKVGNQ